MGNGQAPDVAGVPATPPRGGDSHFSLSLSANLPPPLTGAGLRSALLSQLQERPPFLEGLLHEGMVVLIASDAGVGKSTLFLQLAAQASIGQVVFGLFPTSRPLRVYYLMSERDVWEPLDRLRRLNPLIPFCDENLVIDAECVGLKLTSPRHTELMLNRILTATPDIVEIDPIYGFFEGGMGGDEVAIRVGRFSTLILKHSPKPLGIVLGHHNVKNTKQPDQSGHWIEKESPFYGSQFLKAYVTGYYDLTKDKKGTIWKRKKDTYGVLHPDFKLLYDRVTGLSYPDVVPTPLDKRDQLRLFIQERFATKQPFTASDILQAIPMTDRYLRGLLKSPEISPLIKVISENGNITIFESVSSG